MTAERFRKGDPCPDWLMGFPVGLPEAGRVKFAQDVMIEPAGRAFVVSRSDQSTPVFDLDSGRYGMAAGEIIVE